MKLVLILLLCLLAHKLKGTQLTEFSLDKYIAAVADVTKVHIYAQDIYFREKKNVSGSSIPKADGGEILSWRDGELIPMHIPNGVKREKSYAMVPDNLLVPEYKKRILEIAVQRYRRRE